MLSLLAMQRIIKRAERCRLTSRSVSGARRTRGGAMSAESFLLYYGLRLPVSDEEADALEAGTHPSEVAAERQGLDTWWGNFSTVGEGEYYLFVGKQLGMLGAEYSAGVSVEDQELSRIMEETKARLRSAGFDGSPALWAQWEPDLHFGLV